MFSFWWWWLLWVLFIILRFLKFLLLGLFEGEERARREGGRGKRRGRGRGGADTIKGVFECNPYFTWRRGE